MNSISVAIACLILGLVILASEAASIKGESDVNKRNAYVDSDLNAEERLFVSAAWNKVKELAKGAAPALLDAAKTAAIAGGKALVGKVGK